jgi:hypothetical protein
MNSRSTWNYFSLCQSVSEIEYNALKRDKSETPSTFLFCGKFPQNLDLQNKKGIFCCKLPFYNYKLANFLRKKTFGGNFLPLFNTALSGLSDF